MDNSTSNSANLSFNESKDNKVSCQNVKILTIKFRLFYYRKIR